MQGNYIKREKQEMWHAGKLYKEKKNKRRDMQGNYIKREK